MDKIEGEYFNIDILYNNNKYLIFVSSYNNVLKFCIENKNVKNDYYENIFTLQDLFNLNRFFKLFDNIQKIYNELINIIQQNVYLLNNDKMNFYFSFNTDIKNCENINLIIPKKEKIFQDFVEDLCLEYYKLTKETEKLNEELNQTNILLNSYESGFNNINNNLKIIDDINNSIINAERA